MCKDVFVGSNKNGRKECGYAALKWADAGNSAQWAEG